MTGLNLCEKERGVLPGRVGRERLRGNSATAGRKFLTAHGGFRVQCVRMTEFQVLNCTNNFTIEERGACESNALPMSRANCIHGPGI